jgi:rifampin ADP-ribosylating transferase
MTRLYHGTRSDLRPGERIDPTDTDGPWVYLTPDLDAAIWAAELAPGDGAPRVYLVEPAGAIEEDPARLGENAPRTPAMTYRSREPLRVTGEITEWLLYHGTRASLAPGDLIAPGRAPNFGNLDRTTTWVYFTRTLDAAIWGAELAAGDGPGRIYTVEPTGPIEDDPNLTDKKFRGNPTKSFRSRDPLRVTGEVTDWQGHSAEAVQAMRDGLARLAGLGVEPIDD